MHHLSPKSASLPDFHVVVNENTIFSISQALDPTSWYLLSQSLHVVTKPSSFSSTVFPSPSFVFLPPGTALVPFGLRAKSGPPPVFVNKVLLEPSHIHSLIYCLWLLCLQGQSLVVTTKTTWPTQPKIFLLWPVIEKVYWSRKFSRLQKYYWLSEKKKGLVMWGIYEKYIFKTCMWASQVAQW